MVVGVSWPLFLPFQKTGLWTGWGYIAEWMVAWSLLPWGLLEKKCPSVRTLSYSRSRRVAPALALVEVGCSLCSRIECMFTIHHGNRWSVCVWILWILMIGERLLGLMCLFAWLLKGEHLFVCLFGL